MPDDEKSPLPDVFEVDAAVTGAVYIGPGGAPRYEIPEPAEDALAAYWVAQAELNAEGQQKGREAIAALEEFAERVRLEDDDGLDDDGNQRPPKMPSTAVRNQREVEYAKLQARLRTANAGWWVQSRHKTAKILAAVCSNTPSEAELLALPPRVMHAFAGYIDGKFRPDPEA
jgi:hypothetical protein